MEARFAGGSMGRVIFVTEILHEVQNFCDKEGFLRPAGGASGRSSR
jgi:hypothetical protein